MKDFKYHFISNSHKVRRALELLHSFVCLFFANIAGFMKKTRLEFLVPSSFSSQQSIVLSLLSLIQNKKTSQSENRYFAQQPLGIPVICLCIYSQAVHLQYLCSNQMSGYLPAVPNFSSLTGIKCLGSDQLFAISRLFPPPPSLYREALRNPSQGRVLFG